MQLETARLILRPLQQGDLDGMLSVLGDPNNRNFPTTVYAISYSAFQKTKS